MKIPSLDDLVQTGFLPSDEQLLSLVMKACARPDAVFVAMDILNRNYAYVSESCEAVVGYSADKFLQGGAIFMLSMLEPAYMLAMIEQQERNLREIKSPQFNPTTVLVHEYRAAIRQPVAPRRCLCFWVPPLRTHLRWTWILVLPLCVPMI